MHFLRGLLLAMPYIAKQNQINFFLNENNNFRKSKNHVEAIAVTYAYKRTLESINRWVKPAIKRLNRPK